ncbi:hypothetical protein [Tranquillimonas alkanivorans]|uniref:Uncharacterized protein n=1 Tax=Tranquillimonas alkanivorans TaxID=441119 RepID=A0A1I5SPZ9_9RHOB|nr:hypothetical protein [Tranquillimonas alkanivorans]SFP72758.1 hypothetical protein SAMN04488047_111133 [Tranquillimonas alkanivorans]
MFENLKTSITMLLEEIAKRPEDRHVLQEALREKISEMRALGHDVPDDILRLEQALEDPEADEYWDNMPV